MALTAVRVEHDGEGVDIRISGDPQVVEDYVLPGRDEVATDLHVLGRSPAIGEGGGVEAFSLCNTAPEGKVHFFFLFCTISIHSIYDNFFETHSIHKGVQKFSKIIINGSILNTKFAVERLDKDKHF